MCSYCVIVSLQFSCMRGTALKMYCRKEKRKGKREDNQKKKKRGWGEKEGNGMGEGKGEIALQVINTTKNSHKQSHLFQKLHFLPMQCCCIQLAKQKGNPILKAQQSQFCHDLHSEAPLTHRVWHTSAIHLSPYTSS